MKGHRLLFDDEENARCSCGLWEYTVIGTMPNFDTRGALTHEHDIHKLDEKMRPHYVSDEYA